MKEEIKGDFPYMPPEMKAEVRTIRALSSVMELEGGFKWLKWSAIVCAVSGVILSVLAVSWSVYAWGVIGEIREQNERWKEKSASEQRYQQSLKR